MVGMNAFFCVWWEAKPVTCKKMLLKEVLLLWDQVLAELKYVAAGFHETSCIVTWIFWKWKWCKILVMVSWNWCWEKIKQNFLLVKKMSFKLHHNHVDILGRYFWCETISLFVSNFQTWIWFLCAITFAWKQWMLLGFSNFSFNFFLHCNNYC